MLFAGLSIACTGFAKTNTCNPSNTSVSFDMDKVVLKLNVGDALWRNKWALCSSIFRPVFWQALTFSGSGEQWIQFFEQHNAKDLAAMVREINDKKTLIPGTAEIIQELHDKHYTLLYATNMSEQEFALHRKTFPILQLFVDGVAVAYHAKKSELIRKPNPLYYTMLLNKIDSAHQEFAIFIDDKIENVIAARKAGMIGIHFKNPEQLRKELVKFGVLA